MITVKRTIFSAALILLLSLSLFACSSKNAEPTNLHELLDQGATEEHSEPAAMHDAVIVPAAASDALVARARTLCAELTARTGIAASFFFDNETLPMQDGIRLILLGNTAFALSQKHLRELRRDDYVCALDEGALILGGKSDGATLAAIDRFATELLPYADAEILINADQQFLVTAQYPITSVTLSGFSLGDYRIVYPKNNTLGEAQIASALRETIADRCGYYPEILPDHKVSERTRILAIGACFDQAPASEPSVVAVDSFITLRGNTQYALCAAAQAFCDYLFPEDAPAEIVTTLTAPIPVTYNVPSFSTFVGALRENGAAADIMEISIISSALRQAAPALAPFCAVSQSTAFYLQANLFEYAHCSIPLADGRTLPLFYCEDILTLLEQTTDGAAHILRFRIRETDVRFTLIHVFADDEAEVRQIIENAVSDNEPILLFLMTPSSLAVVDMGTTVSSEPHVSTSGSTRTYMLCSPSKSVTPSTAASEVFTFTFAHPFLWG